MPVSDMRPRREAEKETLDISERIKRSEDEAKEDLRKIEEAIVNAAADLKIAEHTDQEIPFTEIANTAHQKHPEFVNLIDERTVRSVIGCKRGSLSADRHAVQTLTIIRMNEAKERPVYSFRNINNNPSS